MLQEKNALMRGTASEVEGVIDATIFRKTQTDSNMVISAQKYSNIFQVYCSIILKSPRVTFSPDSTGRAKPSKVISDIKRLGIIILNP